MADTDKRTERKRGGGDGGDHQRLPIKVILPKQYTEKVVPGGGTPPKPFVPVDRNFRSRLRTEVVAIREAILSQVKQTGSAPVRVKLRTKAVAKSHRPDKLFEQAACPIIGAGRLGELFIKGTPVTLNRLARVIDENESDRIVKELSAVEDIEPITPKFRRRNVAARDILRRSPRTKEGFMTRVRLFDFGRNDDQRQHDEEFKEICQNRKLHVSQEGYSPASCVYGVECRNVEDVEALSRIVGVRSVTEMPLVYTIRPRNINVKTLPKNLPRAGDVEGDYPVVVVVDSGIAKNVPGLETWVAGRIEDVAEPYRNTDHGTFVAGLICWGAQLNPSLAGIDASPCGVFDLQVIPNSDPAKGDTEGITEQEFLQSLETALKQHANRFKVWNLSIGTPEVCSLDDFSAFAEQLDNLQEKYEVSFVISAGNYDTPPLLDFPRTPQQLDAGRITSPADSVLGISVGSISHLGYKKNGPEIDHPSAFSRHGAGPNYIIKPDLVHYGGTCTTDVQHIDGVRSINGAGSAEDLGTSFATPLVSRTLAHVYHQITPTPKPVLARALLTHHARDPRTGGRVPDDDVNFLGFGRPSVAPICLECTSYSSTLIFEDHLRPGYFLEWDDFPYPQSLRKDGRYFGEVWMTVALAPARGARWGSEYCETHIDAHFGVYYWKESRKTGDCKLTFKGLVPPEHKNPGLLYESYQVERLRKWAPVRTYYGDLGDKGERGERWRLKVQLLTRHGVEDGEALKSQPFSLILTIMDPEKRAPVYDEMAQVIRNRFQADNLAVRAAARIRARN